MYLSIHAAIYPDTCHGHQCLMHTSTVHMTLHQHSKGLRWQHLTVIMDVNDLMSSLNFVTDPWLWIGLSYLAATHDHTAIIDHPPAWSLDVDILWWLSYRADNSHRVPYKHTIVLLCDANLLGTNITVMNCSLAKLWLSFVEREGEREWVWDSCLCTEYSKYTYLWRSYISKCINLHWHTILHCTLLLSPTHRCIL